MGKYDEHRVANSLNLKNPPDNFQKLFSPISFFKIIIHLILAFFWIIRKIISKSPNKISSEYFFDFLKTVFKVIKKSPNISIKLLKSFTFIL